ncbi:MAG: hypothetical protein IJ230_05480 [Clostridia bacterium]|nr:hypothetical protein [Clostridia bacterium]
MVRFKEPGFFFSVGNYIEVIPVFLQEDCNGASNAAGSDQYNVHVSRSFAVGYNHYNKQCKACSEVFC